MVDTNKKVPGLGSKISKYLVIFLALALGVLLALAVLKVWFMFAVYDFFFAQTALTFGLDSIFTRLLAVLATCLLFLALPSIIPFVFGGKKRKEVLLGAAVAFAAFSCLLYFGNRNVYFSRVGTEVKPIKFFIKTMEGFKFSSAADFDPQLGLQYEAVTPEVMQQYYFWKKYDRYETMPTVQPGKYFDMLTGKPIVWYVVRSDGEFALYPLPGFDPKTGKALLPMNAEVVRLHKDQLQRIEETLLKQQTPQDNKVGEETQETGSLEVNRTGLGIIIILSWLSTLIFTFWLAAILYENFQETGSLDHTETKIKVATMFYMFELGGIVGLTLVFFFADRLTVDNTFRLVILTFLSCVLTFLAIRIKPQASQEKPKASLPVEKEPDFTLMVEKKESESNFNAHNLRLWHKECSGGKVVLRFDSGLYQIHCQRCLRFKKDFYQDPDLANMVMTSLDGQQRLSYGKHVTIITRAAPEKVDGTLFISGPSQPSWHLEPHQTLENWIEIDPNVPGLRYAISCDGGGFTVNYLDHAPIVCNEGCHGMPLRSNPGRFKLTAHDKPVQLTLKVTLA
jgi:hypothetical protein